MNDQREIRYRAARDTIIIGAVVNMLLSIIKVMTGVLGHSAAMVADGLHSISDLVSDGVVWFGLRIARREADASHPYGHGKFETLSTLFLALILLTVAVGIVIDASERLSYPEKLESPGMIALWGAIISIFAKEGLFQYTLRVGRRLDAKALIANAWHHRTDAISSAAALVGIVGARLGWPILDPIAAVGVAFIVGKAGVSLMNDALKELTDSAEAVDVAIQRHIADQVTELPEVRSAHLLKARRLGPDVLVDVHVVVDPFLSVSEGHQISEKVRVNILEEVHAVSEVLVHIDTIDDHREESLPFYSDRHTLHALVANEIEDDSVFSSLKEITPHYTPDGIILIISLEACDECSLQMMRSAGRTLVEKILSQKQKTNIIAIYPHIVLMKVEKRDFHGNR